MVKEEGDRLCVCGHTLDEHHRVWYAGGAESADECEAYGFNETGGMQHTANGWIDHCQHFRSVPFIVDSEGVVEL